MRVAVSGGFDPIHPGHVRLLKGAAEYGKVVVLLNSDRFLITKKGRSFMSFEQRCEILEAIRYVDMVVPVIDDDMTVCKTLYSVLPDYFANGGDRVDTNTPEMEVCKNLAIKMLWNIGGGKLTSSSHLLNQYAYDIS